MKATAASMYWMISSPRLSKIGILLYVKEVSFSKKFGHPASGSVLRYDRFGSEGTKVNLWMQERDETRGEQMEWATVAYGAQSPFSLYKR